MPIPTTSKQNIPIYNSSNKHGETQYAHTRVYKEAYQIKTVNELLHEKRIF